MNKRKFQMIVMTVLFIASLGVLATLLMSGGMTPYLRADQLTRQADRFTGVQLRVAGRLHGQVERRTTGTTRLVIAANGEELTVECTDAIPPNLAEGSAVLLDGMLRRDGVFYAHRLLTECSSRYTDKLDKADRQAAQPSDRQSVPRDEP